MSSSLSRRVVSLKLPASVLIEMSDELLEICRQCGTIYQYVLDLAKDQLLIEIEEFSAVRLFNKFKRAPPKLGGYAIRVASTTRQEMIRAQVESHDKDAAIKKPSVKSAKIHDFNPSYLRAENGSTSAVLCAHVDKETAEVKHDVLRQAFSKYGRVVCLVSYRHKGTLYCLVQYSDAANAREGLRKLHGMHIYDDCCILRVFHSNLGDVVFKDDGRGYRKLVHQNPQIELSKKTVAHLQVWSPNKGVITEQNRTKETSKKVVSVEAKGNPVDRIPKIPKFSAINNALNTSRSLQVHDDTGSNHHGSSVKVKKKDSRPNQNVSRSSEISNKPYYKVSYTPIKPKDSSTSSKHKQQKVAKSTDKISPVIVVKQLPPPASRCDRSHEHNEATTTGIVKTASADPSCSDKASSTDILSTVDRPSSLDITNFTLSLDPSDASDIDTDASASSICDSKRLGHQISPVSYCSVETAVGCQDVVQSSTAIQCSMGDDELEELAVSCREQLDELKKKAFGTTEVEIESRNKELLLENANLKKLLSEVHCEMRRLKEIVSSVAPKVDASTQVDPTVQGTIAQGEIRQSVMKCDKGQQTEKLTESPRTSVSFASKSSHKRSSPCSDPTYEPHKKKQKKKSTSSSPSLSIKSPQGNSEKTGGYALKIRSKFLHTHLQSFLKSQKFIKSKLDTMKEGMNGCSADVQKFMSTIVPQFENMYDITVELANLEQCSNEDELFSCISKLSSVFPSLIAGLNESLAMKVPGVSLTVLSVLKKMEYLATEMTKYSPRSKTLAFGNATTGETTSVESSLGSNCNTPTNTTPPPLLSLDEAVEMFDEQYLQQCTNTESVECVTSLTVSISTKFLHRVGGKRLFNMSDDNTITNETEKGGASGSGDEVQPEDHGEGKDQGAVASPDYSHDNVFTVLSTPDSDEPVDIELVENDYRATQSVDTAGETAGKESDSVAAAALQDKENIPVGNTVLDYNNSNNATINTSSGGTPAVSFNECSTAPPTNLACQTTAFMPAWNNVVAESQPCSSAIPSNQSCSTDVVPMHNSAPPIYNASTNVYSQPHSSVSTSGGFTPLLPQPYIPTPIINISRSLDGLVVKWTLEQLDIQFASQVYSYCLCVFQGDRAPDPDFWHTIGEVQAMKLPMACTLRPFEKGQTYHFAVRAVSHSGVCGQFSQAKIIQI